MIQDSKPDRPNKLQYDGAITIATGRSRHETAWKNKNLLWSELADQLAQTQRTRETYEEYKRLPKAQRDTLKDIGGFVGGPLKGGRRTTETASWRTVLTLDADYAKGDLWASVEMLVSAACVMYSTHSHSPRAQRLRLVLPLSRPVTPDEYQALARRVAADLGMDFFDDTTYQPHRLMYWPSTAADGEYVYRVLDEPWLDPDAVLARYPDWRDVSYWPESSRATQQRKKLADKQGDPESKPGLVGAFCRTYSIAEAIEEFLAEVYRPAGEDRYTYIPGSSAGGLVLYDDGKFAYSHHGSDPISGRLVNSFDLIRLHRFGELDEGINLDIADAHLPSQSAMLEFAAQLDAVKRTLGAERLERASEDFGDAPGSDWMTLLDINKRGEIKETLTNLVIVLRHDPNLQGIAYDAHRGATVLLKPAPWRKPTDWRGPDWSDDDDDSLQVYVSDVYHIYAPAKLKTALVTASHERVFHPIRDYLNGLPEWDGLPRLDSLLIDYLGAEDSAYTRAVTRKTLAAAVARVMRPGCKYDYMLVLNGPQGVGKSTLFERLGGQWFNDSLSMPDMRDKTGAEKLQGYWILEIGELAGIKKAEVEAVKSFLSRQRDIYRPAYGRRTVEHPRQCIVVGSTNAEAGFLRDSTGNRRFWPVAISGSEGKAPWDLDGATISQIWAEAVDAWKAEEPLYLTGEVAAEAYEQQRLAMEADERLGMVKAYLDTPLPEDWESRSLADRRLYLQGGDFGKEDAGTVQRERVCVAEVWCECFGKDLAAIKRFEMDELHGLIRQIEGWERYDGNKTGKLWFEIYGAQRAYVRKPLPTTIADL